VVNNFLLLIHLLFSLAVVLAVLPLLLSLLAFGCLRPRFIRLDPQILKTFVTFRLLIHFDIILLNFPQLLLIDIRTLIIIRIRHVQ